MTRVHSPQARLIPTEQAEKPVVARPAGWTYEFSDGWGVRLFTVYNAPYPEETKFPPTHHQGGAITNVQPFFSAGPAGPDLVDTACRAAWDEGRRRALENGEDDYGPWPPVAGVYGWQEDDAEMHRETERAKARAVLKALSEATPAPSGPSVGIAAGDEPKQDNPNG